MNVNARPSLHGKQSVVPAKAIALVKATILEPEKK